MEADHHHFPHEGGFDCLVSEHKPMTLLEKKSMDIFPVQVQLCEIISDFNLVAKLRIYVLNCDTLVIT